MTCYECGGSACPGHWRTDRHQDAIRRRSWRHLANGPAHEKRSARIASRAREDAA